MSRLALVGGLFLGLSILSTGRLPDDQPKPATKGKASPAAAKAAAKRESAQPARRSVPLRDKLYEPINLARGIDPNTPLRDALEHLGEQYDLSILIDTPAFKEAGQEAVAEAPVQLPRMIGVQLDTVLRVLAIQVSGAYLLKTDHLEITTQKRAAETVWGAIGASEEPTVPGRPRAALPLVSIAFINRPLDDALRDLTDRTGVSVILDLPRVGEQAKVPVTATLDNVPLDSAVRLLAAQADLHVAVLDNVLVVTTRSHAQVLRAERDQPAANEGGTPEMALALRLRQPVDVDLEDIALHTVVEMLGRETGTQVLLDQRAADQSELPISLHLKDVSLETAVRLAAESAGLKPALVGNVLFVTSQANADKLQAEHERALKNASQAFGTLGLAGGLGIGGGGLGALGGPIGLGVGLPGPGTPMLIAITPQPAKPTDKKPRSDKQAPPKTAAAKATRTASRIGQLSRKLAEVVTLKKGIDANTSLRDALEYLDQEFQLAPILVDTAAFKAEGIDDVASQPVQLPRLAGVRLGTVLEKLAALVHGAYLVRADHIALTTAAAWQLEIWGRPITGPAGGPDEEGPARHRRLLPLVHAAFDQRPLDDALRELADATGFSVVLDVRQAGEHARAPVSALLNNVPLDTAVRLLADQASLQAVLMDNVLQVTTRDRARALAAEQERLNQNGIEFLPVFKGPPGG